MNKNRHRTVFNAVRGLRMAVAETARALGKPNTVASTAAALTALALPAQAQIAADPAAPGSQRPTVLNAANGVPLVNITTPSAAGVSRNTYRQFDVGAQGVILNNSRTDAPTQLGGWVSGNPWLAAGGARVILNEVNASQPSQLNGFVEVGGQRAEVIIANPAGINVNGGGFINASRATLTTGTPVMNAGALEGFRVQGGQVRVEGLGLDVSLSDHAAVLARAVAVNAGIWANALTVVTGVNDVSADASRVTSRAAAGVAPAFALDVAALGGMYAGKIRLVGTEAGLGVNQAGLIDAQGPLTLDVNGWLGQSAGARLYGDGVSIRAQGVRNKDGAVIAARDSLSIVAGAIHNTEGALLLSAGDMALSASERIENRSASIEALGNLSITTPVLVNANDHFETQLVQVQGPFALSLIQPSGSATQIPVGSLVWQEWERAGQYAYNTSPDPHAGLPSQLGTTPIPEVGQVSCSDPQDDATCVRVPGADYPSTDPAWAYFGLAAPSPAPAPPPPLASAPTEPVLPPGATPAQLAAHELALLAYQSAMAQHQAEQAIRTAWETWNTETEARYTALDARLETYNQGFAEAVIRNWTRFDIQRTVSQTQVVSSAPGRITAGGDLSLYGQDLFNDNSEIVAGGALRGDLHNVVNQATPGVHVVQDSGTTHSSWVYSRRSGALRTGTKRWRRDTSAPAPYAPPNAITSVDLQVTQLDHNVVGLPPAPLALPGSALFAAIADPTISRIFETDPRFINDRQWLSSDFMLRALATDPNNVHKRLGDGFIEQRLIREQVGQLTGQRFLGDFTNDEAQFLALMDAGAKPGTTHRAEVVNAGQVTDSGQLGDQSTAQTAEEKKSAAAASGPGGSAGIGTDKGFASSVTTAAISGIAGDTQARTGDAGTGIAPIFDRERVKDEVGAQITITAAFFQQAPKAWADHAGQKQREALARGDAIEAERWGEGGTYRAAGHVLLGALGGGTSGAAGALASATAMPEIGKLIDEADLPTPVKQALGMVTSTTLGALAGNTAGAAAAFGIDTHNRQLHPSERKLAKELASKSGGRYTAEQIEEQMRLMGNLAFDAAPNSTEVLTTPEAIAHNIKQDPGMPKTSDGRVVVEIPGQANADIQQFIIGNSTNGANYIPGVSPYVGSRTNGPSASFGTTAPATTTARCANGDLACISGVGQQQSAPLTQQAKEAIADGIASTGRAAGVVAAGATAVGASASPQIKPIAGAVAVGATAIGTAADAIEQVVRPDMEQVIREQLIFGTPADVLTRRYPLYAPLINEIKEALQ